MNALAKALSPVTHTRLYDRAATIEFFVRCTMFIFVARNGLFEAKGRNINHFNDQRDFAGRLAMTTEDMQKFGNMDAAMKAAGGWSEAVQAIAVEFVDYTKKSAESSAAAWEKLLSAKSLESAVAVQTEYLRSSYEDFVARAAKFGQLYTDLARQAYRPFEGTLTK